MAISLQKRGEALKILKALVARNQARPDDCVFCRICEDALEENILQFEEMWMSEEELVRHLRSDEYRNLLLVMEMALKQPEIRFDTISSSTGIETIEKARSHAK
jgi:quinol monooxygenase YgiN